jgi:vitamin B12 transporter
MIKAPVNAHQRLKSFTGAFVVIISFFVSYPAQAQDEQSDNIEVGSEIVVTARRIPEDAAQTADNITVITAKELSLMPVNDLPEALNFTPGLDIQFRGPFGHPTSLSIQGCNPSHVRIMVDGVFLNSQGNAFADPSQIPIENVERIEIIKGSGSSVWGSSLGGVINVVTKSPELQKSSLSLSGGWGVYEYWKRVLELSGKFGEVGYYVWESSLDTNSAFRANSEIESQRFGGKFNYPVMESATLEANFQYYGADAGGYEFETLGYGEDYLYITRYGSLKFALDPKSFWDLTATAKFSEQDTTLERFMLATGAVTKVDTNDYFSGLDLVSRILPSENQTLALGADLGRDRLESDQIAGEEILRRKGYYASYLFSPVKAWDINAGLRFDDNAAYGEQLSPSAGVVYHLDYWKTNLRVSVSKAFNAPQLIYKYISNPFMVANEDLKAERAVVYEGGVEMKPFSPHPNPLPQGARDSSDFPLPGRERLGEGELLLKFSGYRAEVKDLVSIQTIGPWLYKAENVEKTRRQGAEAEVKYALPSPLMGEGRERVMISAGWEINRIQDRLTGKIIQGNGAARTAYNVGVGYHYTNLNVNLKGNYRFWNEAVTSNPKDRRFIWDAAVNYDLTALAGAKAGSKVSAFFNVLNIFDREYWYNELLPLPGRRVELGLKYSF